MSEKAGQFGELLNVAQKQRQDQEVDQIMQVLSIRKTLQEAAKAFKTPEQISTLI